MLDINRPIDAPYMVLESDIECSSRAIHVLNLQKKTHFTIGRRANNDLSVSDISVSRRQAFLQKIHETVFLQDIDSKFGTFK